MQGLSIGAVFAGHRVEEVAGRGGMGVVYRATHLALDRTVALKLIAPELAQDESFRERFKRESRIAASLDHPNVIPIFHAGEEDGLLYITMRHVEGTDLRALIASAGALDPPAAAEIIAQVASGLDAAHARGLVHRDVKPANILIEAGAGHHHAYLTDFGLTRHAASGSGFTRTGEWVGTVDYVAPEQIEGKQIDARTDVYALGCVLYQALCAEVPYPNDSDLATMWAHMNNPPPSPIDTRPELASQFDEVVTRAMAKDPAARYPSAGDLGRAALAAAEGRRPVASEQSVATGDAAALEPTMTARTKAAPTKAAPAKPPPTRQGPAPATASRLRPAAIALAAVSVLGLAVAALAITGTLAGSDDSSKGSNGRQASAVSRGSTRTPTTRASPSRSSRARNVERAVESHWRAILQGRYGDAYDDFSPRVMADPKVGARSQWIASHSADPLEKLSVAVDPHSVREDTARARVITLRTQARDSGCKKWSGDYGLVRRGGDWLIDEAAIVPSAC